MLILIKCPVVCKNQEIQTLINKCLAKGDLDMSISDIFDYIRIFIEESNLSAAERIAKLLNMEMMPQWYEKPFEMALLTRNSKLATLCILKIQRDLTKKELELLKRTR